VRNWLGQDIQVGSVVGRGARQGNSSDFKIGVVTALGNRKVRVQWKFESSSFNEYSANKNGKWNEFWAFVPRSVDGAGSPSIETLMLLDQETLDCAVKMVELADEARSRRDVAPMSKEEFLSRLENLYG
jgi:hypothetical protein